MVEMGRARQALPRSNLNAGGHARAKREDCAMRMNGKSDMCIRVGDIIPNAETGGIKDDGGLEARV
jgi:hypothetical protein